MDVYSFINSRDVAAYCREIKKIWNPFEMSVIVARSHRSMQEKHAAWRELITDYPDMPTPKNMHYGSYESLHQKLAELIDYEERSLALLYQSEPNAVYIHKAFWHREYRYSDTIFSNIDMTLADVKNSWEHDEVDEIIIEKSFLDDVDSKKGWVSAIMDYEGNPYSISSGQNAELFPNIDFDNLLWNLDGLFYIDIPVPFKRGDILSSRHGWHKKSDENYVFVLDSLDNDDPKKQARRLRGEMSDGTDLLGNGFFADDSGLLYWGHAGMYDCFEYYRGNLEGKDRILHYVSLFMRNYSPEQFSTGIGLPELLTMQSRIILEHRLDKGLSTESHGCYISEPLRAENRLAYGEKEHIEKTDGLMPWVAKKLSKYQVEFLVKETGSSSESIQTILGHPGGGHLMSMCARIVHDENHFERTNDSRFNQDRRVIARMILESYGNTEDGWVDKYSSH